MKKNEKRLLIILGILVVITVPYFVSQWLSTGEQYDELGLSVEANRFASDLNLDVQNMPDIDLEALSETKEAFTGASRNLFVFGQAAQIPQGLENEDEPIIEPEEEMESILVEEDDEEEQQGRQARGSLAGYEYLGYHVVGDTRTALFFWRGRTFVGIAGSVINDTFKIKQITSRSVIIQVLNGDFEQRLKLSAPASENTDNDTGGSR
jgi:hypothetical protein